MADLNSYFSLWKAVLQNPEPVFKSQMKKASLEKFAKNLVIAGLIVGFISGLAGAIGISNTMFGALGGVTIFIASLALWPIILLVGGLVNSAIYYIFAKLLGGRGSFSQQAYLISLFTAPLTILTTILLLVPIVGLILTFLIGIYSLYLLTLALKQVHGLSTGKAVLVWLLPIVIILLFIAILAASIATFFLPLFANSSVV